MSNDVLSAVQASSHIIITTLKVDIIIPISQMGKIEPQESWLPCTRSDRIGFAREAL